MIHAPGNESVVQKTRLLSEVSRSRSGDSFVQLWVSEHNTFQFEVVRPSSIFRVWDKYSFEFAVLELTFPNVIYCLGKVRDVHSSCKVDTSEVKISISKLWEFVIKLLHEMNEIFYYLIS